MKRSMCEVEAGSGLLGRPDQRKTLWGLMAGSLLLSLIAGVSGCGRGSGRERVSGTVTIDGLPVKTGTITLQPMPGTNAASAGAPIQDGRFEMPREYGAMPGKYLARIVVQEPTGNVLVEMGQKVPEATEVPINEAQGIETTIESGRAAELNFNVTRVGGPAKQ